MLSGNSQRIIKYKMEKKILYSAIEITLSLNYAQFTICHHQDIVVGHMIHCLSLDY